MPYSVRVPGSSANLGPGYDSFALALAVYASLTAEEADRWSVSITGEGAASLSQGEDNLVIEAMKRVFAAAGEDTRSARLACANGIPLGQGLGSSAAAIVGGMLLAAAMCERPPGREELFRLAAAMDGHPDNVAASLLGGMTVAWTGERIRCAAIGPASGLAAVVVPAAEPLATPDSRHLLPAEVPHADAARNSAWSGVLVAGMTLGDPELIAEGMRDCIHEPYRAQAVSDLGDVRSALVEAGALGGVLSGAGPAVVGLVHGEDDASALELAHDVASRASRPIEALPGRDAPRACGIERHAPAAV